MRSLRMTRSCSKILLPLSWFSSKKVLTGTPLAPLPPPAPSFLPVLSKSHELIVNSAPLQRRLRTVLRMVLHRLHNSSQMPMNEMPITVQESKRFNRGDNFCAIRIQTPSRPRINSIRILPPRHGEGTARTIESSGKVDQAKESGRRDDGCRKIFVEDEFVLELEQVR